jgi:predicted regulator of Ras-like GTPase activity (Roadblock/LC7/MglB family)
MLPGINQELESIVTHLVKNNPSIKDCAVCSFDGFVLASTYKSEDQFKRIAARSAALISIGELSSRDHSKGKLEHVVVKNSHGLIMLVNAQDKALLTVHLRLGAQTDLIYESMRTAADQVSKIVQ